MTLITTCFYARLRPGTSKGTRGMIPMLRRVVGKLREAYGARMYILIRLNSGFANPRLYDVLEELKVKYVVGLPSNKRLKTWSDLHQPRVRRLARESGDTVREFTRDSGHLGIGGNRSPGLRKVSLLARTVEFSLQLLRS